MRILVVDDQISIAEGVKEFLIQKGFNAFCVHSGSEALDFLERQSCDLVISDFKMPDLNGLELLKALRLKKSNVHFIMISAYLKMEDLLEAIKLKISDVFSKPFKNAELLQSIEALKSQKMIVFQPTVKKISAVTGCNHSVTSDYELYLFQEKSFQGYFSYFSGDTWRFLFYTSEKYSADYLEGCFFALNTLKKSFKDTCSFLEDAAFPVIFMETDFREKVNFLNLRGNPVFHLKPEGEMLFFKEKRGEFAFEEQGVFGISETDAFRRAPCSLPLPKGFSRLHPLFLISTSSSFRPSVVCAARQKNFSIEFDLKKNGADLQQLRKWLDPVITTDLMPSCAFNVKSIFSDLCDLEDNEKSSLFEWIKFEITSMDACMELRCNFPLKNIREIPVSEGASLFLHQLLKHRHDFIMKYAEFNGRTLLIRIPAV